MKKIKRIFFIVLCFGLLSISLLSLLASNEYIPNDQNTDLGNRFAEIVQAKMALDEGQFPLRTAPWQNDHFGNAWFQFYSPVYFTVITIINKFIFPYNSYLAMKFVIWLSMLLGAIFFHRLILFFTKSNTIAFLSATVYVMSPYLFVNIFIRGAIAEAVAQGLIPIVLYYSMKLYFSKRADYAIDFRDIIFSSVSWFFLLGTHLITFVYLSFFLAFFLLLYTCFDRSHFKQMIPVGISYVYSIFLGFYFIVPIALYTKYIRMDNAVQIFPWGKFFTPLPTLLSMVPTSPMPKPGNGWFPEMKLYVSLGLPTLFAIGAISYILIFKHELLNRKFKIIAGCMIVTFLLAFYATWTPFDFWPYVPKVLRICQFTYRLLAQTMWIGTILFAVAIFAFSKGNLHVNYALIGVLLIVMSTRSWIPSQRNGQNIQEIIAKPDLGYGRDEYLVVPTSVHAEQNKVTMSIEETSPYCKKEGKKTLCDLAIPEGMNNSVVQIPLFYYPDMLNVTVNGKNASYVPTSFRNDYTAVGLKLIPGNYKIESYFQGVRWANFVSIMAWFICLLSLMLTIKYAKNK